MKLNLNTKVNIVPNNDVKYTRFKIIFPFHKLDKDDYYNLELMIFLMNTYSLKFQGRDVFVENNELHYISDFSLSVYTHGDTSFLYYRFSLPGEGFFDDFDLEKSLKVTKSNLFKSIILDKEATVDKFNTFLNVIINNVKSELANPKALFNDMWAELYDVEHKVFWSNTERLRILNSCTSLDRVCELYEQLILKGDYVSFIGGNVSDKEKYSDIFSNVFKPKKEKFSIDVNYRLNFKPDSFGHVDKTVPYTLSALEVSFHKYTVEEKDKYLFLMLDCFLSRSENNHLLTNLRLKNNLIYSCSSVIYNSFNTIAIKAYLSKENVDKALQIIDDTLVSYKNKDIFEESKKRLLKADSIVFIDDLDDYFYKFNIKVRKTFKRETFEDEFNIIKNITYEEFSKFIDDLMKDSELIMIGDKND